MLFSFINAPSSFQYFVNDMLRPYLNIFYTAYINDILIYSNNLTKHRKHIKLVLEVLRGTSLQLNINKCKFYKTEILYFGLIILINGV